MNYERYNLSQLARITKTNPRTLYEWIRLGYLVPCQIAGSRKKYSIQNFLDAEKKALKEAQRRDTLQFLEKSKSYKKTRIIPDYFFDHIEEFLD